MRCRFCYRDRPHFYTPAQWLYSRADRRVVYELAQLCNGSAFMLVPMAEHMRGRVLASTKIGSLSPTGYHRGNGSHYSNNVKISYSATLITDTYLVSAIIYRYFGQCSIILFTNSILRYTPQSHSAELYLTD